MVTGAGGESSGKDRAGLDSRALVVHDGANKDHAEQEDDEEEFDPVAEAVAGPKKWLAMGKFYSGQPFNEKILFAEMSKAWGFEGDIGEQGAGGEQVGARV